MFNKDRFLRRVIFLKRTGKYSDCLAEIEEYLQNNPSDIKAIREAGYLYYYFGRWGEIQRLCVALTPEKGTDFEEVQKELQLLLKASHLIGGDESHKIEGIRLVPQVGKGCIPAATKMILNHWRDDLHSVKELCTALGSDLREQGTSIYSLLRYLHKNGYQVYPFSGNTELVKELLEKDFPVLVIQRAGWSQDTEHARVVIGYDNEKGLFYTLDPSEGEGFIPYGIYDCLGVEDGKNLHVLICPPGVSIPDWWRSVVLKDVVYHNLLGVTLDELGKWQEAEQHFQIGMSLDPHNADLINNYAILLARDSSKLGEALRLSHQAVLYGGNESAYIETIKEITRLKGEAL